MSTNREQIAKAVRRGIYGQGEWVSGVRSDDVVDEVMKVVVAERSTFKGLLREARGHLPASVSPETDAVLADLLSRLDNVLPGARWFWCRGCDATWSDPECACTCVEGVEHYEEWVEINAPIEHTDECPAFYEDNAPCECQHG